MLVKGTLLVSVLLDSMGLLKQVHLLVQHRNSVIQLGGGFYKPHKFFYIIQLVKEK